MKNGIFVIVALCCFSTTLVGKAQALPDSLGEQVLEEINLARADPQLYADYIREWRKLFRGKFYQVPGKSVLRQTREGILALNEALEFLKQQKPLPPLQWSPGLAAGAADLSREQARTGASGHKGAQSGVEASKVQRHGAWKGEIRENIAYVPNEARMLVMQLIVDDGVPDRAHRKNLFNPHFKEAGVACGPHERFGIMCVADFSAAFLAKNQNSEKEMSSR